jgi:hypothetical protein
MATIPNAQLSAYLQYIMKYHKNVTQIQTTFENSTNAHTHKIRLHKRWYVSAASNNTQQGKPRTGGLLNKENESHPITATATIRTLVQRQVAVREWLTSGY